MAEQLAGVMSKVQVFGIVMMAIIIALYVLTIIWVVKDAPSRGVSPVKWGLIALIPFIGAIFYSALRPPMLTSDREEQDMDYLLRQRELMKYGECGKCSYPVQDDYIMCPNCGSQLKNICTGCGKPLNPEWNVCPYCTTKVVGKPVRRRINKAHQQPANASSNSGHARTQETNHAE